MGLGASLMLMALGAVLRWAVTASTSGINLHTVGLVLLIIGAIGFVISLFWMSVWADRTKRTMPDGSAVYPDGTRTVHPDAVQPRY